MRTPGKHIVVFLQNKPYLGNQIALIPFFQSLREINPRHGIVVCAHEDAAWALDSMGYIDQIVPKHSLGGRKSSFFIALKELRKFIIDTAYTFRRHSIKAGLLARFCATREVVGFAAKTTNLFLHRSVPFEMNCYAAENALALIGRKLSVKKHKVDREKKKYFLIIPGGSLPEKKYPLVRYLEVAEQLESFAPVHFLLGDDMTEEIQILSSQSRRFVLHVGRPLSEVADIVKGSAVVIANDCGPVHFAHIYDIPRVILFAETSKAGQWFHATSQSCKLKAQASNKIDSILTKHVTETVLGFYSNRSTHITG